MSIEINSLIEWSCENDVSHVERVLHYEASEQLFALINIFAKTAQPVLRTENELIDAINSQKARLLEKDPFAKLFTAEQDIPEKYRKKRDQAWTTICLIVEATGFEPYIPYSRWLLIKQSVQTTNTHKKVIYERLLRYWQAGKIKNALLPNYKNCGTNNKWRENNDAQYKKIGRPNCLSKKSEETSTVRITSSVKLKFERGIKKFYLRIEKPNLTWAYRRTLGEFFHNGYEFKEGIPVPILPSAAELPTFRQFYHWYEKDFRNDKRELKARLGNREFEMNHRALLGDSTAMAFGPGSVYQTDATIGDIYLVSEFDRTNIIGRPVIYFVIDVFSRYIVGIAVTLEGPSWIGAMLALDNVVADKVAFCAEHGISIKPEQWNCHSLGEAILADRGEFEGFNADSLVNNLGIRLHNTPPYRGDFKGIVERAFGKANEKFIHFAPGAVIKPRERGEKDYRLDAVLTLKEFRALLITYVLNYNANQHLSHYRKDEFQIKDAVDLYPQDLWNWGIKNRSGYLRTVPREIVRLNLLPRKMVSVTAQGIHFEKEIYYTCDLARQEGWFERARNRGSWKIEVAYDPRNLDSIYIPLKNGQEIVSCHLTPAAKVFHLWDWYEARAYFASKVENKLKNETRHLKADVDFHATQQNIIGVAEKETSTARRTAGKQSKRSQTENIRRNRFEEREEQRRLQFFDLNQKDLTLNEQQIADKQNEQAIDAETKEDVYIPPKSNVQRIQEIRKRKMGK